MHSLILMCCVLIQAFAWEQIPNIPSGHRSQFYILQNDGSYKYGYDVGDGHAAKQSADPSNQVEGHYFYTNPLGQKLDLKYSAGTQGFVPVGLEKILQSSHPAGPYWVANPHVQNYASAVPSTFTKSNDGSYTFGYTSDTQERSEQSDAHGNIRGRYSYKSPVGTHDLSYVAGSSTGFLPTGGSLIVPPGATKAQLNAGAGKFELDEEAENEEPQQPINPQQPIYPEGPTHREEPTDHEEPINPQPDNSGDESDNDDDNSGEYKPDNLGEYVPDNSGEYTPDNSGEYQPGSEDTDESYGSENGELRNSETKNSGDASYNFKVDTPEYKRTESADPNGNIQGSFSFSNNQGTHDLQYEAGAEKGFIAKSGSLSVPNGLINGHQPWQALKHFQNSAPSTFVNSNDGSYSFGFSSDDQDRTEQGDANGNVRGRYSYKNAVGSHDLNYVAGSATGFLPTGGSLVPAPGLTHDQLRSQFNGPVNVNGNPSGALLQNHASYGPGNLKLVSYLPSKLNENKYGYIFETN